jgi:hypothetical protein
MTRDEMVAYVNQVVEELLAKPVAKAFDGMNADTERAERRIAELEFEKLVQQNALMGGVLPKAVPYIASSAAALFELRDGMLTVRNGETDPGDPLVPLTFDVWLRELRKEQAFLFTK